MFLYIRRHGYYLTVDPSDPTKFALTLERPPNGTFMTDKATGLLVLASDSTIVPRFQSQWDPPFGVRPKQLNANNWCLECEEDDHKAAARKVMTKCLGLWKESLLDTGDDRPYARQLHWLFGFRES